jgi:O-acetylhomoserine/O-acetylserine sulfhydrylase-like pyridoxal-dependent enzyme
MSNFLQDNNNNFSSKRLSAILAVGCAVALTLGTGYLAVIKGNDLGTNIVALILGLFTIGSGTAIAGNMVEKK